MRNAPLKRIMAGVAVLGMLAGVSLATTHPNTGFAQDAGEQITTETSGSPGSMVTPANGAPVADSGTAGVSPPASPIVPASVTDAAASVAAPTAGSATTNLGGSDIAVSSAGGSYEVDGPKRRSKRMPTPPPRP